MTPDNPLPATPQTPTPPAAKDSEPVRWRPSERALLYLTVFLCGAVVMALELLGPRLISVYFGVTTYSWTALIGVTLLCLSAGYLLGGIAADRWQSADLLHYVMLGAAGFTQLILLVRDPVLISTRSLGLRWGALTSAVLLFAPVFVLLGMVTPLAIRMLTRDVEQVGRGAGRVFGISTVGSFVGTLLAGWYFIPTLGVKTLILCLSGVLAIVPMAWFALRLRKPLPALTALLLLGVLGLQAHRTPTGPRKLKHGEILFIGDSLYGQVKVYERAGVRMLLVNNGIQTHFKYKRGNKLLKSPYTQSAYVNFLQYLLLCRPQAKTMLDIGLGGANIPKLFHGRYGTTVDVVELDPMIPEIARRFFWLKPGTIRDLYVEDGRSYISRTARSYDLIVLDAYVGGNHPYQLLTLQAFRQIKRIQNPGGIFALSLPGALSGPMSRIPLAVCQTLSKVFAHLRIYTQSYDSDAESLLMIFASDQPLKRVLEPKQLTQDSLSLSYLNKLIHRLEITGRFDYSSSQLITDDENPVSRWEWRAVERWRDRVIQRKIDPELFLAY